MNNEFYDDFLDIDSLLSFLGFEYYVAEKFYNVESIKSVSIEDDDSFIYKIRRTNKDSWDLLSPYEVEEHHFDQILMWDEAEELLRFYARKNGIFIDNPREEWTYLETILSDASTIVKEAQSLNISTEDKHLLQIKNEITMKIQEEHND